MDMDGAKRISLVSLEGIEEVEERHRIDPAREGDIDPLPPQIQTVQKPADRPGEISAPRFL
jgi:hypothetical protein